MDYSSVLKLSDTEKIQIYSILYALDVTAYPEEYDPDKLDSDPSEELNLIIRYNGVEKRIFCDSLATDTADTEEGQRFIDACRAIQKILTDTNVWNSIPEPDIIFI